MFGRIIGRLLNRKGTATSVDAGEARPKTDHGGAAPGRRTLRPIFSALKIGGPVLLLASLIPLSANTFEIPTTPSGSWTASGVTTGTVPFGFDAGGNPLTTSAQTGTYFKTTPSGLRMSVTVNGAFPNGTSGSYFATPPQTNTTGLNPSAAGTNPGVFTTTPTMPASTNPITLFTSFNPCVATFPASTTCTGLGTARGHAHRSAGRRCAGCRAQNSCDAHWRHREQRRHHHGARHRAADQRRWVVAGHQLLVHRVHRPQRLNVSATEFFGDPNAAGQTLNVNCGAAANTTSGCGTVQVNGNHGDAFAERESLPHHIGHKQLGARTPTATFFDMSFDEDFGGASCKL